MFPSVILGLTDDLTQRRQGALWIDLSAGGLLVTGAPGSGKTTALWTLALSLALLHPPDSQHIYALSMTAGLDGLGVLPHVQTVSGVEAERVRRVFRRLTQALDERRAGQAPAPHMTLLIDGFEPFRDAYYDAHVADLERLAAEGRAHGITVAVTAISITALPERLRALIPQRVALRPAHPSEWGLMAGPLVPRAELSLPPGRGVVAGAPPLVTQLCIPSEFPVENPAAVLHEVGAEMRAAYQGASGRDHGPLPVRRLPTRVPFESLPHPASGRLITALGVQDDDAQSPLLFDWMNDGPHVVIAGGARTGKTNLLHAAALGAALDVPPNDLRLLLVDFSGRSLRALAGLPHAVHVTDPAMLDAALHDLPDVPMAILIDDYDLAADVLNAEGGGMALRALRDLARMRSDVYVWAAGYLDRAGDPLIRHLLMKRAGFALGRDGLNALGLRGVPDGAELAAPGRAVFAQHTNTRIVQTAWVEDAAQWVEAVKTRWGERETPAPRDNGTPRPAPAPFDIDTAGLIQDLLAGEQPDTAPQDAKPTKRRTARKRR